MIKKISVVVFTVFLLAALTVTSFADSVLVQNDWTGNVINVTGAFGKTQKTPLSYNITYTFDFAFRCDTSIVDKFYSNLKTFGIKVSTSEGERILTPYSSDNQRGDKYSAGSAILWFSRGSDMSAVYKHRNSQLLDKTIRNSHCVMTATLYGQVDTNNHLVLTSNTGANAKNYEIIFGTAELTFDNVPMNVYVTADSKSKPVGYFSTPSFSGDIMPNFQYDTTTIPWTYFRPYYTSIYTSAFYSIPAGTDFKFGLADNIQKQYGIAAFTTYHNNYALLPINDSITLTQRNEESFEYDKTYYYSDTTYNVISNVGYTADMDGTTTGIEIERGYHTLPSEYTFPDRLSYTTLRKYEGLYAHYCNGFVDPEDGTSHYAINTLPWVLVAKNGVYYSEKTGNSPMMNAVLVFNPTFDLSMSSATDIGVMADKYYLEPSDTWDIGTRLYNFLIWICFEMPILSPLLSTIFILIENVVGVSENLLIPFISITGLFGMVILFRIVYSRFIKPFSEG